MDSFRFFEREDDFTVVAKRLPHWAQAGTLVFITWRTADSLPHDVQVRFTRDREQALAAMGLNPRGDWKAALEKLPAAERGRVKWELFRTWDDRLDGGAGACVLRRPALSAIVEKSLLHFDGERYVLTDSIVMPNHVHFLAAFPNEPAMFAQCESWKRFTALQINKALCQAGEFWQVEQFDHLVRSEEQFWHFRRYIEENGRKAGLKEGEYRWFSKNLEQIKKLRG
jgi:REP element-mobilizing transposase RayT